MQKVQRGEADLARVVGQLADFARAAEESRIKVALLEREIVDLKSRRDEWGRRIWNAAMVLAAGVVGYYLKR